MLSRSLILTSGLLVAGVGCSRDTAPAVYVDRTTIRDVRDALNEGVESAGGGGGGASLGDPTGWATITGKFTLAGAPPTLAPIAVTKDTSVCGSQAVNESLVVGPGGGIKDVLVFLTTKIPGEDPAWVNADRYSADATAELLFDQKKCVFLTHVGAMRSTQTLKVLNSDTVGHNTNFASKRGAKSQDILIPSGGEAPYAPGAASPAPFPISCAIHPWMKAWLMVCDHPYFAVTKVDGSFEIADVPAGVELEFRVWQERGGFLQTVAVNGADEKWSKGRFKITLTPDEQREMNVVVPGDVFQ